jgi:fructose-1-phosphate kinase PfkB-like protein
MLKNEIKKNQIKKLSKYGQGRKTYNNRVCVKGSISNEFEVDYYKKLEEVIELLYHNEYNIVFFIQILLVLYHR